RARRSGCLLLCLPQLLDLLARLLRRLRWLRTALGWLGRHESRQRLEPGRLELLGEPAALEQLSPLVRERSRAQRLRRLRDGRLSGPIPNGDLAHRFREPLERTLLVAPCLGEGLGLTVSRVRLRFS